MATNKNPLVSQSLDPILTGRCLQDVFELCKIVRDAACSCGAPVFFTDSLLIAMREIQSCIVVCNSHVQD